MNIHYSFILLVFNQWQYAENAVRTLIESLDASSIQKGIEILIIDNGSDYTDQLWLKLMANESPKNIVIKSFRLERNLGYPLGINYGLSKCAGKIIGILNSDLIFIKGWFEPLVKILCNRSDIGLAVPYLFDGIIKENNLPKIDFTDRAIGACMVIKREVIEKVGGNDFWFGIGHYDDDDWCLRIRIAGYKIVLVGNSLLTHIGNASFSSIKYPIQSYVKSNQEKFLNKWRLTGIDTDRSIVIKQTAFIKKVHYIPFEIYKDKLLLKKTCEKVWLFTADWNNDNSCWKQKIKHLDSNIDCILWIPKQYFNVANVLKEVNKFKNHIRYITGFIPPLRLLEFIQQFYGIVEVPEDFVNQYVVFLGKKLNKAVI